MNLSGHDIGELGSFQDRIQVAAWYRREQLRLFETMINVYVHAMSLNPEIVKKVQKSVDDYMEILIPGIQEFREEDRKNFVQQQADTLKNIFNAVKSYDANADSSRGFFKRMFRKKE